MSVLSNPLWNCPLAVSAILLLQMGSRMLSPSQSTDLPSTSQSVSVVIWTDREQYSLGDTVRLNLSLQNAGEGTVYVDRRMYWGGYGGGLKLVISDEQGKPVPRRMLNDALMPPPKEGDASILIRLEKGYFYGTGLELSVREIFPKPGRYSIRVIYKSWLRREFVAPQLRDLPVIWEDAPDIPSAPIWVAVKQ